MNIELVLDQCETVLVIKQDLDENSQLRDKALRKLFSTRGYLWLKERESSLGELGQPFTDNEFEEFVLSRELKGAYPKLRGSFERIKMVNLNGLVSLTQAYLPRHWPIDSYIVPLIKPLKNSFVYPIGGRTSIFFHVDPALTDVKLKNIIVHELHHVGLGTIYQKDSPLFSGLRDSTAKEILKWTQALGEGYALLAAAGGINRHPNYHDEELRAIWDERIKSVETDFLSINQFFLDILRQELDGETTTKLGFEMFGVQGPWYTVEWLVAVTIERALGRQRLIHCIGNPVEQFQVYNDVVKTYALSQPSWSQEIIDHLHENWLVDRCSRG